jgi:hypothetical protein
MIWSRTTERGHQNPVSLRVAAFLVVETCLSSRSPALFGGMPEVFRDIRDVVQG